MGREVAEALQEGFATVLGALYAPGMPPLPFLNQLIREAASEVFGEDAISRVSSKAVAASYGDDMLSVSIVFTGSRSHDLVLEKMSDARAAIHRLLQHYGEERFAMIDYDAEGGWERKRRRRPTAETTPGRGGKVSRGAPTSG